jgi:putative flippase GtrA
MLKWFVVGSITFGLELVFFLVFFQATGIIPLSNFVAIFISTSFNYLTHKYWTFETSKQSRFMLFRYILVILTVYLYSNPSVAYFNSLFDNAFLAKAFSILLIAPISYLAMRSFVFDPRKKGESKKK